MRYNAYKNLVYKFYNSLKLRMDERDNILDYIMKFRFYGKLHLNTLKDFA